jgi:hypothetical protein
MINRKYVAPDGKAFKKRDDAVRYMNNNNLPGAPTVIKMKEPKTKPKKQEIYFLPIVGLRLIKRYVEEIPDLINQYYTFYRFGALGSEKEIQEGQYWQFIVWILTRMPENQDKPKDYFMDIYNDFKRDLKKDMEDNNELYGHHKSCTEYGKNYENIVNYWDKHTPKEGYEGSRVSNKYQNPYTASFKKFKKQDSDYFTEPLYYHETYGWGLALTNNEVISCIIEPLSNLYTLGLKVAPVVRGHEVITHKSMNPNRLKPLGRSEMILRPLLLTQGIFCPCRLDDSIKTNLELNSYNSTIQNLIDKRLLFKISGDEFGSLKLINWPYNDPPI